VDHKRLPQSHPDERCNGKCIGVIERMFTKIMDEAAVKVVKDSGGARSKRELVMNEE
jgi:hypothetical protein